MLNQDALHRNAGLPSVGKSARNATFGGVLQIAVAVHDHTGISAQLQYVLLFSGLILDRPSDGGAARKADELDSIIGDQQLRIFIREQQHIESTVGPARLLDNFRQQQSAQRSLRRRLENHGTSSGHRGSHFVRYQIQWKIKRRYARNGPEWKPPDDTPPSRRGLLPVERQIFTVAANRLFGSDLERENGAVYFDAGCLDWLARFLRKRAREFFFAFLHAGCNLAQNALPLECR